MNNFDQFQYPEDVIQRNADMMNVISPLSLLLSKVSHWGMPLDEKVLLYKSQKWKEEIANHWGEVYERVGRTFNMNSSQEKSKILYNELKLTKQGDRRKELTSDAYSMAFHSYNSKATGENEELFYHWRRSQLLYKRLSSFVDKFLIFKPCENCQGKGKVIKFAQYTGEPNYKKDGTLAKRQPKGTKTERQCEKCVGTGNGECIGFDDRYVSLRDGIPHVHSTFLQTQVTLRVGVLDINLQQVAKKNAVWDIGIRDIFKALDGHKFVECDLSKAELKMAGTIFNDAEMLRTVDIGSRAFLEIASDAFGIDSGECSKNSVEYVSAKICTYSSLYGGSGSSFHDTLLKSAEIYYPVEKLKEVRQYLRNKFRTYFAGVQEFSWECMKRGYVRSVLGNMFRLSTHPELEGYNHYKEFINNRYKRKAQKAFNDLCTLVSSFLVQSSATGAYAQLNALKVMDSVDKFIKPDGWNEYRVNNGDWSIARVVALIHDELILHVRDDYVDPVSKIVAEEMGTFNDTKGFIKPNKSIDLKFDCEADVCQWRDIELGDKPDAYK